MVALTLQEAQTNEVDKNPRQGKFCQKVKGMEERKDGRQHCSVHYWAYFQCTKNTYKVLKVYLLFYKSVSVPDMYHVLAEACRHWKRAPDP